MRAGTISFVYRTFSRGGSCGPLGLAAFLPPSCGAASGASFAAFPFFCLSSFFLTSILQSVVGAVCDRVRALIERPYSHSMVAPHFLHERTRRPSARILFAIRVCFLQF